MAKKFTWGEALDYTLKTKWRGKAGLKTNIINTGHFTQFAGRSFPVERINQVQMDLFAAYLKEERDLQDATVNRCITAIGTVLNTCAKREFCNPSPCFEKYDEGERRMFWFTQDQVEDMAFAALDPFSRDEIRDIILVAAWTGMRQAELLKLRAKDVDLDGASPRIHVGGVPHLTTKPKNYRAIPIHTRIEDLLHKRLDGAAPNTKVFDDVGNKDQLLLAFKKVRNYAKAPEYNFHDLRHSFGTWHAIAGTPMRTLMGLMGHKRIETTLHYAKHTDKAAEAAMAAL